jgi:hypothetical protein
VVLAEHEMLIPDQKQRRCYTKLLDLGLLEDVSKANTTNLLTILRGWGLNCQSVYH